MPTLISFLYPCLLVIIVSVLASIFVFIKTRDDANVICAIYDGLWVLMSVGSLFFVFLTAGNQVLRSMENNAEIQQKTSESAYIDLLQKAALTKVCSETIVLRAGQIQKEVSDARDAACKWARETEKSAQKVTSSTLDVKASCSSVDDIFAFGDNPDFGNFEACKTSRLDACSRARCEFDKAVHEVTSNRSIKPMPKEFDSTVLNQFEQQLAVHKPTALLNSEVYKTLKPISPGDFAQGWVFVFAFALGLRLAKGAWDIVDRYRTAIADKNSWLHLPKEILAILSGSKAGGARLIAWFRQFWKSKKKPALLPREKEKQ